MNSPVGFASLHEAYSYLHIGDYFTDTLHLSAQEHAAFRLLLLSSAEWEDVKPTILPLLTGVTPAIVAKINELRAYDGHRLPPSDWRIVRDIVFERDGYACTYCGARATDLQGDHVIPLSRGGSNAFLNVVCACKSCNQSKSSKTPEEWKRGDQKE